MTPCLRTRIFGAFEMAELAQDDAAARALADVRRRRGRPTGVEVAGQIAELAHRSLGRNFRHVDPAAPPWSCSRAATEILPTFGDRLSGKATRELTRLGVDVRVRTRVTDVTHDEIVVTGPDGDERIACHTKVWAAGVARARWPVSSPMPRARPSTVRVGSRCCRTARCPATPRSMSSAT